MRRSAMGLFCAISMLAAGSAAAADSPQDLRNAPTKNWPMVAGDWGNGRYSQLAELNSANVKTLGGAWSQIYSTAKFPVEPRSSSTA